MRLEGQYKMGYYPTPVSETERILKLLTPPANAQLRILDPCAGEGEAIRSLYHDMRRKGAQANAWAVELSPERCRRIKSQANKNDPYAYGNLITTLNADYQNVIVSKESISLLWLNPPYDWSDDERDENTKKKMRQEYAFFKHAFPTLQKGGVLVYIVPEMLLQYSYVRQVLADNLAQIFVYRFAPDTYETFKQIVILGVRRDFAPSEDSRAYLDLIAKQGAPDFDDTSPRGYRVPQQIINHGFVFRANDVPADDLIGMMINSGGAFATKPWQDSYTHRESDFRPLVQPRAGHVATLIASGMMGIMRLPGKLLKGNTATDIIAYDKDGLEVQPTEAAAVKLVTTFTSQIHQLDLATGNLVTAKQPEELEAVFTENAAQLAEQVINRYTPLYDGQISPEEDAALSKMIPYKKLPGMKKPGLLPLQKQLAVATARSARKYGFGILVGEMGIGKTAIALSTLEILPNAYPAVVLVPSHLVPKWIRECQEVNPDTNPVEISRISDVDKFFRKYSDPKHKGIAVISKEKAKLGPGWRPSQATRVQKVIETTYSAATDKTTSKVTYPRKLACPNCGEIVPERDATRRRRATCQGHVMRVVNGKYKAVPCNTPLYVFGTQAKDGGNVRRRWPISKYIKDKGYQFGTFIGDEAHKYKGKSTDQGRAFHNLAKASRFTLALTGTLFGGKASDLYFLLYRLFPRTLKTEGFKFNAEKDFVAAYGRLERIIEAASEEDIKHGHTTAMERRTLDVREIPGITPAIYRHVLPYTIFAKIDDLGVAMPDFKEKIHRLPMTPDQEIQYQIATGYLLDRIRRGMSSYDSGLMREARSLLGVYLQMGLGRPNTGFRAESVWWKPRKDDGHEPYWIPQGTMPVLAPESALIAQGKYENGAVPGFDADDLADLDEEAAAAAAAVEKPDSDDDKPENAHDSTHKGKPTPTPTNAETFNAASFRVPPGREHMVLQPAIFADELLPKERWLVDLVSAEIKRNRHCIIYVRQTATRDIQPRIREILRQNQISAEILPDGDPRKREGWIHSHPCQALITNAIKVETGLDLVMFQTIIFYEMVYSLFTFWQALRRVWRLGQTRPVEVHYSVYNDTIEEKALALMGQKMKAAHLLYGDTSQTVVSEAAASQDFMAELTQRILKEQHITLDGIEGLVNHQKPETEPLQDEDALAAAVADTLETPDNMPDEDGVITLNGEYTVGGVVEPAALTDSLFSPAGKEVHVEEPTPQREVELTVRKDYDPTYTPTWNKDDLDVLEVLLDNGRMVLSAEPKLGLPTIHDIPNKHIEHMGFGYFRYLSPHLDFDWDAGGAMKNTRGEGIRGEGLSYTTISLRKSDDNHFFYDFDAIKAHVQRLYARLAASGHVTEVTRPAAEEAAPAPSTIQPQPGDTILKSPDGVSFIVRPIFQEQEPTPEQATVNTLKWGDRLRYEGDVMILYGATINNELILRMAIPPEFAASAETNIAPIKLLAALNKKRPAGSPPYTLSQKVQDDLRVAAKIKVPFNWDAKPTPAPEQKLRYITFGDRIIRGADEYKLVELHGHRAIFTAVNKNNRAPTLDFEVLGPDGEIADTNCVLTPYLATVAYDNPTVSFTSDDAHANSALILQNRNGKLPTKATIETTEALKQPAAAPDPKPAEVARPGIEHMAVGDHFMFQNNDCRIVAIFADGTVDAKMEIKNNLFPTPIITSLTLDMQQFQAITGLPPLLPQTATKPEVTESNQNPLEDTNRNKPEVTAPAETEEERFIRIAAEEIVSIGHDQSNDDDDLYAFFSTAHEDTETLEFIGEQLADGTELANYFPTLMAIASGTGTEARALQVKIAKAAAQLILNDNPDTEDAMSEDEDDEDDANEMTDEVAAALADLRTTPVMQPKQAGTVPPRPAPREIAVGDRVRIGKEDYTFTGVHGPYVLLRQEYKPGHFNNDLHLKPYELEERANLTIPAELRKGMPTNAIPQSTQPPPTNITQGKLLRIGHLFWLGSRQYVLCSPTYSHIDNPTVAAREYTKPGSSPRTWKDAETFTLSTGLYLAPDFYDDYSPAKWTKPIPEVPIPPAPKQAAPAAAPVNPAVAQAQAAIATNTQKKQLTMAEMYATMGAQRGRRS